MRLVEPDLRAGDRMADAGVIDLPGTQPIAVQPLMADLVGLTELLDLIALLGLKDVVPVNVDIGIVADVHHAIPFEAIANRIRNLLVHEFAVADRRCATLLRRYGAQETEAHRPTIAVGIFVVLGNLQRRMVFRGRVDVPSQLGSGRRPVHVFQELRAEQRCERDSELLATGEFQSADQERAVGLQQSLHVLLVFRRPLGHPGGTLIDVEQQACALNRIQIVDGHVRQVGDRFSHGLLPHELFPDCRAVAIEPGSRCEARASAPR